MVRLRGMSWVQRAWPEDGPCHPQLDRFSSTLQHPNGAAQVRALQLDMLADSPAHDHVVVGAIVESQ
jgi:hypothetical protein